MKRLRKRRHNVEHDNVHRWLVSYADYMTLLFALFVVLYAIAMVNDKPFETITESVGHVFQASDKKPKNRGHGDDILNVNTSKSNKKLFGNGLIEEAGPELFDNGIIYKVMTPIVVAKKGKNVKNFYTQTEYDNWYHKTSSISTWDIQYKKGLASLEDAEYEEIIQNPNVIKIKNDKQYKESLEAWFGKDSTPRKEKLLSKND